MKKENKSVFVLFGIFYLREQLHNYIDILESYSYQISEHLGSENTALLLNRKLDILYKSDKFFTLLKNADIVDKKLFEPQRILWIEEIVTCDKKNLILNLSKFDQSAMKWCYWFLSEDNIDVEISGFLLEVIEICKEDIELLLSSY